MTETYPIILTPISSGYLVYVPDFDINTEGKSLSDAIYMARDAIGIIGIDMEDNKEPLPSPSDIKSITCEENDISTLVDVDFSEYRRKHDNRTVKKNCTLPSWLNEAATARGLNFSQILQDGLKSALGII